MQSKYLTRSRSQRQIAGVCGGLADYLGVDPALVRIAFVLGAFTGLGIGLYLLLWLVMPADEPPERRALRLAEERYARGEIDADDLQRLRRDLIA